jgi:hypothetical protein
MGKDICDKPLITRALGPDRMTFYQVNDSEGRYVVLSPLEALFAARAITQDLDEWSMQKISRRE